MATKSKSAPRAKAKPKTSASQKKKKPAPKKSAGKPAPLKIVAKQAAPKKTKQAAAPQPEHKHPFWKLLEAKEQQRKEHEQQHGHPASRGQQKQLEYRHQAKFARFAGPRRRAA